MAHIDIQISSSHSYLQPDEEGPDLFVHWSNLQCQDDVYKTLNDDEVVEFDMDSTETASGEKYVHVAKIAGTRRGLMAPSDLIFETSLSMKSKQFSSEWIIHAQEKPRMMRCIWTQDAYTLSHKLNVCFFLVFFSSYPQRQPEMASTCRYRTKWNAPSGLSAIPERSRRILNVLQL